MAVRHEKDGAPGYTLTTLESLIAWGRKYSLYPFTFATACCGIEVMGAFGTHYDLVPLRRRGRPFLAAPGGRAAVAGTINYKMAPVLKRIYDQMLEPKWVISMGACACSGGFYKQLHGAAGIDKIIPVDVYIPGCPPNPRGSSTPSCGSRRSSRPARPGRRTGGRSK